MSKSFHRVGVDRTRDCRRLDNSQPNIPIYYVTCWEIHSVVDKEIFRSNNLLHYTTNGDYARPRQMKTFDQRKFMKQKIFYNLYFFVQF